LPSAPSHRTQITFVHSPACHFCEDAAAALDEFAARYPLEITTVELESPAGAALVARHHPAMNPLVVVDGEFFSSGRLPRKKLARLLERHADAAVAVAEAR